jgi:hypothetical protein
MAGWAERLDQFLGSYPHLIAALEAVSTFAAVLVSLSLAVWSQRANRTQIKAVATISVIMHSSLIGKPKPTYVVASIRNTGVLPALIPLSFFHWKLPFRRGSWLVTPHDYAKTDQWVPQQRYPVEIKPRGSHSFFLSEIELFRRVYREQFLGKTILERCCFYFLYAQVVSDDGRTFKVKIDRVLRKQIRSLRSGRAVPSNP